MMKKLTAALCVIGLSLALTGCQNSNGDSGGQENTQAASESDGVSRVLAEQFHSLMKENPQAAPQEIADAILENSILEFQGATLPVEQGLLTGFGNAEISGFSDGVMFSPMIGSIPFVGYVFTVEEGQDMDAFIQNLKNNADLRWNVCTEADVMVVEKEGNTVFFLMCPDNL